MQLYSKRSSTLISSNYSFNTSPLGASSHANAFFKMRQVGPQFFLFAPAVGKWLLSDLHLLQVHCELDWKWTCWSGCRLPKTTIFGNIFTSQLKYLKNNRGFQVRAGYLPKWPVHAKPLPKTLCRWLFAIWSPDCDTMQAHQAVQCIEIALRHEF